MTTTTPWKSVKYAYFHHANMCIEIITTDNARDFYTLCCPLGNWDTLEFLNPADCPDYYKFLDVMVCKTVGVLHAMAKLRLDQYLWEVSLSSTDLIRVMRAMVILDPTFRPPWIHLGSRWQRGFLHHLAYNESYRLLDLVTSERRLCRFSAALCLGV
jgi:hypothetical protein